MSTTLASSVIFIRVDGELQRYVFPTAPGQFENSGQALGSDAGYGVSLGDVDGDGDLDALVSGGWNGANRLWLNDGSGTFSDSGQTLGGHGGSTAIALGDLDGDGDLDAFLNAYQDSDGAPERVWLNDGTGSFTATAQPDSGPGGARVLLGDLDGDADLDAVLTSQAETRIWLNDGAAGFTDSGQALPGGLDTGLADFDGDGSLDLLIGRYGGNAQWHNNGAGDFSDTDRAPGSSAFFDLGDTDGDGHTDAVFAVTTSDPVWRNDGSGNLIKQGYGLLLGDGSNSVAASPAANEVQLGDLNGDGDLDAIFSNSWYAHGNEVLFHSGPSIWPRPGELIGVASNGGALGDLDGDGDLDLFATGNATHGNSGSASSHVWLNHGSRSEPGELLVDAFDTGLSSTAPTRVTYTEQALGSVLGAFGDVDLYRFELTAGAPITIDVDTSKAGVATDTALRLFASDGSELARSDNDAAPDDSGPGADPYLYFIALESGSYYAGVSAAGNIGYDPQVADSGATEGNSGHYDLTLSLLGEPGDSLDQALNTGLNTLEAGSFVDQQNLADGQFGAIGLDVDLYRVDVAAGATLEVDLSPGHGAAAAPEEFVIQLFDATGDLLATRHSDAEGSAPYLAVVAPLTGEYTVGISATANTTYDPLLGGSGSPAPPLGTYNIRVNTAAPTEPGDQAADALVLPSLPHQGLYQLGDGPSGDADVDLFRVTLDAGQQLVVDVDADAAGLASDAVLRLFDAAGNLLAASNDDPARGEQPSLDPFLSFVAPSAADYYVGVSGAGNTGYDITAAGSALPGATGLYRLLINTGDPQEPGDILNTAADAGRSSGPDWTFEHTGTIGDNPFSGRDVDLFALTLWSGDEVVVDIDVDAGNSDLDSVLRVFDSFGAEVALNNDRAAPDETPSLDSYLSFTADAAGRYFVGVSGYANLYYDPTSPAGFASPYASTGSYSLQVEVNSPYPPVTGTTDDDALAGTPFDDVIPALAGNDYVSGLDGDDRINGGSGSDTLHGGSGNDTLRGGDDGDRLFGHSGDDRIEGQQGHDTLGGDEGSDLLLGGPGNDSLQGDHELGIFSLPGGADDTLYGGDGADTLDGNYGNDLLDGGSGNDLLTGGSGDDLLLAGNDNDSLHGGPGHDTLSGGEGNDTLDGSYDNDRLDGGSGDDLLTGGDGDDLLLAGSDDDSLHGGPGNDTLFGADGTDTLFGEDGDDVLIGWTGGDELDGGSGNDKLLGGADDDALTDDLGNDTLYGAAGNDSLSGGADADTLRGAEGNDTVEGGDGNDLLEGNDGIDHISGGGGQDTVLGGLGNDLLAGGAGDDVLVGAAGDDRGDGGNGDDQLNGNDGNDTLNGGGGGDHLFGGSGNDRLNGNAGNDTLYGGGDADTFVVGASDTDHGADYLLDFTRGSDTIEFSEVGAGLDSFDDLDTNLNTVLDAGDGHVAISGAHTIIDITGATGGAVTGTLTITGVTGIEATDLLFS